MSGNFSSALSLKHGWDRKTHTPVVQLFLEYACHFSLQLKISAWFINCILRTVVCSSPLGTVKAVTVTALTLEPRTQCLLCKLIWWLGGWHILSRLETLLGLTDRASWGRGRRACPTVLWKTRHRGWTAGRLRRQPSKRQPVQNNNNTGVVRWNQTELHKQTRASNKELRAGRLKIWR